MASSINADNGVVSGSSGLKSTADTSGVLALQSNGSTALSVGTDLNVTLTNPLPVASGGTGATSLSSITVGTATNATNATTSTNLAGGSAGTVPYQSASGTTQMLAAGTSGQVLTSSGAGAPTWTTPSSFGVTSVGSVVRKSGSQLYLATATNSLITSGYVPQSGPHMSGTAPVLLDYPRYSTYYGAWVSNEASTQVCYMSKDGINWTPTFTKPSTITGGQPQDGGSVYVVDDGTGYIYCFGTDSSGYLGYWIKTSINASWSGVNYFNYNSGVQLNSMDFVWFGSSATSAIVVAHSDSLYNVVGIIDSGTSYTEKINSTNNNGKAMSMDWNQSAGLVVVMARSAGSTSQYSVMYSSGSNVGGSWTGVTRATCGFDPGANVSFYKPVVGPSGAVMWSSMSSGSYYYAASGALNSTWSNTTVGSNQVLYYGHNGTSWYIAKGQPGAVSTAAGYVSSFYTSSSATPTSFSAVSALPLLPLENQTVALSGLWTQRKY